MRGSLAHSLSGVFRGSSIGAIRAYGPPLSGMAGSSADVLRRLDEEDAHDQIHLVTHSMGGIIGRIALAEYMPLRFGRFVMIAPPNRGSHVAARLAPYLGRICPPLVQLTDGSESFVCSLPPPTVAELGIIAAEGDFLVLDRTCAWAANRTTLCCRASIRRCSGGAKRLSR